MHIVEYLFSCEPNTINRDVISDEDAAHLLIRVLNGNTINTPFIQNITILGIEPTNLYIITASYDRKEGMLRPLSDVIGALRKRIADYSKVLSLSDAELKILFDAVAEECKDGVEVAELLWLSHEQFVFHLDMFDRNYRKKHGLRSKNEPSKTGSGEEAKTDGGDPKVA
jgi:hypothetical protein